MENNLDLIFQEQNIKVNFVSETTRQAELLFTITAKNFTVDKSKTVDFIEAICERKFVKSA